MGAHWGSGEDRGGRVPGLKKGLGGDSLGRSLCLKDGKGDRQDTASQDQGQAGGWQHPRGSHVQGGDQGLAAPTFLTVWGQAVAVGTGNVLATENHSKSAITSCKADPPRGMPRANTEPQPSQGRSRQS